MYKILVSLLCLFTFIGCAKTQDACDEGVACPVVEEDADVDFDLLTIEESIDFFDSKKTGVLYFGFEDCPWCQEILPILEESATEANIPIHYVKTRYGKDQDYKHTYSPEQKERLAVHLKDYMSENEEGELTLYVPLVVVVVDGIAIDAHVGTVEGHDAHERNITEKEKAIVRNKYKKMFNLLKKQVAYQKAI